MRIKTRCPEKFSELLGPDDMIQNLCMLIEYSIRNSPSQRQSVRGICKDIRKSHALYRKRNSHEWQLVVAQLLEKDYSFQPVIECDYNGKINKSKSVKWKLDPGSSSMRDSKNSRHYPCYTGWRYSHIGVDGQTDGSTTIVASYTDPYKGSVFEMDDSSPVELATEYNVTDTASTEAESAVSAIQLRLADLKQENVNESNTQTMDSTMRWVLSVSTSSASSLSPDCLPSFSAIRSPTHSPRSSIKYSSVYGNSQGVEVVVPPQVVDVSANLKRRARVTKFAEASLVRNSSSTQKSVKRDGVQTFDDIDSTPSIEFPAREAEAECTDYEYFSTNQSDSYSSSESSASKDKKIQLSLSLNTADFIQERDSLWSPFEEWTFLNSSKKKKARGSQIKRYQLYDGPMSDVEEEEEKEGEEMECDFTTAEDSCEYDSSMTGNPNDSNEKSDSKQGNSPPSRGNQESGGDEDDSQGQKGKRKSSLSRGQPKRKFACPYHKFDPNRYGVRGNKRYLSCEVTGFNYISEVV